MVIGSSILKGRVRQRKDQPSWDVTLHLDGDEVCGLGDLECRVLPHMLLILMVVHVLDVTSKAAENINHALIPARDAPITQLHAMYLNQLVEKVTVLKVCAQTWSRSPRPHSPQPLNPPN